MTLQVLHDADAGRVGTSAQAWLDMAEDLDDATEQLIRGSRNLQDAWPTGDIAVTKVAAIRAEASNAYHPCRRIGNALREHADTLRGLQQMLNTITAEATGHGFTVNLATGTLTAPPEMTATAAAGLTATQRMNAYLDQFQGLLDRAADLDSRTTSALAGWLPDVQKGFGSLTAADLSDTDVRAQQGRPPAEVRQWWGGLTPEQQEQVLTDHPTLVGALDGIPAADRDVANRAVLESDIASLTAQRAPFYSREQYLLSMLEQGRLREVYPNSGNPSGALAGELHRLREKLDPIDGKLNGATTIRDRLANPNLPPAHLIGFSSADDGRAIISVGNPDVTNNVVTYVPGTMSDLPSIGGDLERADRMVQDAGKYDDSGRSTSAIVWLGYDAPDTFVNAGSSAYADHAVDGLQSFQTGLRATHEGTPSHNTVIGHSYGSTTVGFAARDNSGLAANDLIFVGSPGVGVNSASDLHIQGNTSNVWGSTAKNDIIHMTGFPGLGDVKRYGEDPSEAGFGGRTFTTADGKWGPFDSVDTHSAYWDSGNPSRKNIAYIVTGQKDRVQ